jgi:hypothetical protein
MAQWEYCEVDFDGSVTYVWFYDEAGRYIDRPIKHPRLGIQLAKLGHEGWELVSTWWRNDRRVTYMLKRPAMSQWSEHDRVQAEDEYRKNHPKDAR